MSDQLTVEQFRYLDGLVTVKYALEFDRAIRTFIDDLTEEGLHLDDVKQYMKEREERVYFEYRNFNVKD